MATVEHTHEGRPQSLVPGARIDRFPQIVERAVEVHRLRGAGTLPRVLVGDGEDDVRFGGLLRPQLLEHRFGLPRVSRPFDGVGEANSVVAGLRCARCRAYELLK